MGAVSTTKVLLDREGRIIGVLAGAPPDEHGSWDIVARCAATAMETERLACAEMMEMDSTHSDIP